MVQMEAGSLCGRLRFDRAQTGSGRRADLYTDYTFAVWQDDSPDAELVTFAKAYSGLTQKEIERLDRWIRANTISQRGHSGKSNPCWFFELGFEGLRRSPRHKSGIACVFHESCVGEKTSRSRSRPGDRTGSVVGARIFVLKPATTWFAQRGWDVAPFQRVGSVLGGQRWIDSLTNRQRENVGRHRGSVAGEIGRTRIIRRHRSHSSDLDHTLAGVGIGYRRRTPGSGRGVGGALFGSAANRRHSSAEKQKAQETPSILVTTPESLTLLLTHQGSAGAIQRSSGRGV